MASKKKSVGPPIPPNGASSALGRVDLQRQTSADWPKFDEDIKIYENASVPELDNHAFESDVIVRDFSGNVIDFDSINDGLKGKEGESDGKRKRNQTTFYGHDDNDDKGSDSDSDDYEHGSDEEVGDNDVGSNGYDVEEGVNDDEIISKGGSKAKTTKGLQKRASNSIPVLKRPSIKRHRIKVAGEQFLTNQQVNEYIRNGYLVIENFWDASTVATLRSRIHTIIEDLDLEEEKTVFSTKDQSRDSGSYFMGSGRAIRYFWEEGVKDEQGNFRHPKEECINKIGHGLHDMDTEFEKVTYEKRMAIICRELGLEIPLAVQSMFIFKQKYIGGEVCAHQDGTFLYTEPQTCIGFWWALDDCNKKNGCLWAIPGSHRYGVRNQFRRKVANDDSAGAEFWNTHKGKITDGKESWNTNLAVALEIPKGSLVILDNAVVHFSDANLSDRARYAYSVHVVDGRQGVVYPENNWLQRPKGHPFREIGLEGPKERYTPGQQQATAALPVPAKKVANKKAKGKN